MELEIEWVKELIQLGFIPLAYGREKKLVEKNYSDEEAVMDFLDSQDVDNVVSMFCTNDQVLVPVRFEISTNEPLYLRDLFTEDEMKEAIESLNANIEALQETRERFQPFVDKYHLKERKEND